MLGVAEVNRIVDRNIYTILECEEEEETRDLEDVETQSLEGSSTDGSWTSFNLHTEPHTEEEVTSLNPKNSHEKIEKKIDVFKIMKDYVKKHRNKYSSI